MSWFSGADRLTFEDLQGNSWRKKKPTLKKLSFMAYNAGKKYYTFVCEENHQRFGKTKFLPKPINLRPGPILAVLIHSQPDLRLAQTKSHLYPSQ